MVIDIDQGFKVLPVTVYKLPYLDESVEKIALILSESGTVFVKHFVGGSIGHHVKSPRLVGKPGRTHGLIQCSDIG